MNADMELDPSLLTDEQFNDWIRYRTLNQAHCWMKYS